MEEVQPTLGASGFEDRRRPGDRREDEGAPPGGVDERRSGDDRRQLEGAGGPGGEGDARRRRRRGRRGGRGRRRGGAEIIAGIESVMPPAGPATAEAMASDLPTEFARHDREERIEPMPAPPPQAAFEPPTPPASYPPSWDPPASPPASLAPPSWSPPAPPAETFANREPAMTPPEERRPSRGGETQGPALSAEELRSISQRVTEELFKAMGFAGKVTATLGGPDRVEVVAEVSDDEELLTGRKGETRQALQHLLNRMVNKGEGSRYHLQLEINDFWKRREEELTEQARKMADDAVRTGNEQVTEFLNAQERRIIHVTLREDTRVKTYALGDGMIKRLAVAPAHAETMGVES
ncbi:MAG: protein jag [Candidatus Eisenbacteria bacterium]